MYVHDAGFDRVVKRLRFAISRLKLLSKCSFTPGKLRFFDQFYAQTAFARSHDGPI